MNVPPGLIHIVYTFLEGYFRYRNIQMNKQEGLIKRNIKKTKDIRPKAYIKAVYLAIANKENKWTYPLRDQGSVINQLIIIFSDRCGVLLTWQLPVYTKFFTGSKYLTISKCPVFMIIYWTNCLSLHHNIKNENI